MKKIYILLFFSLFLISCNKEDKSVSPEVSAVVRGKISVPGETIAFASLRLDNNSQWSATAGQDGTFGFVGIPNGEHTLSITSVLGSGGSITKSMTFSVNFNNVDLGTIVLPKPSNIVALDSVSKANTLTLKWVKSTDPAFKEYSVYRKNSSNVDETSEMVFHSTSVSDTVFSDSYQSGATKYYKVYAHTTSGAIYTGNTLGINIPPVPPLANGNFEETRNGRMPDGWTYNNQGVPTYSYINLSNTEVKEGKYSLELNWADSIASYSHMANLYQRIQTSSLVPGKTYKFSLWLKSQVGKAVVSLYINDAGVDLDIPSGQDWTEKTYTFQMTSDIRDMRIEIISSEKAGPRLKAWVDDIKFTAQD